MTVACHEIHMASFLTTSIESGLPSCMVQIAVMLVPQPECAMEPFCIMNPPQVVFFHVIQYIN